MSSPGPAWPKPSPRRRRSGARWRPSRPSACRCSSVRPSRTKTTPSVPCVRPCASLRLPVGPGHGAARAGGPSAVRAWRFPSGGDWPGRGRAGRRRGTLGYGAVGEVVEAAAAALQSVARPGSVLVGPATRAATEGIFEWGPGADVLVSAGRQAARRDLPRAAPGARRWPRPGGAALAAKAPLVGRDAELARAQGGRAGDGLGPRRGGRRRR